MVDLNSSTSACLFMHSSDSGLNEYLWNEKKLLIARNYFSFFFVYGAKD